MKPERWQQVDQVLEAALEREPGERAAFVAKVCASDEALWREVESLLDAHERSGRFLDTPPADVDVQVLAADHSKGDAWASGGPLQDSVPARRRRDGRSLPC